MKNLILTTTMLISFNAMGSFMQEECSNADATIRLSTGHVSNKVVFREITSDPNSTYTETKVPVLLMDLSTERLATTEVENNHRTSCNSGDEHGIGFWDNISVVKTKITKKDGSLFSKNTAHVSEDLKSVTTTLICHRHVNSMLPCKKN